MSLEEETVLLTEKESRILARRILHRYHDLRERALTPRERKQIYSKSTGIPQQIVNEELERIKSKVKVPKERRKRTLNRILMGCLVIGGLTFTFFGVRDIKEQKIYRQVYDRVFGQYADANGDGITTPEEIKNLELDILKGKGILYQPNTTLYGNPGLSPPSVIYSNEKRVPIKELVKWLEEYKPENKE